MCRGIDVVRNKIKMFAQKKVTLPPGRHKIIILDEADRYSTAAFEQEPFCLGLHTPGQSAACVLVASGNCIWALQLAR